MKRVIDKTVALNLTDSRPTYFMTLSLFIRQAQRQGWKREEIDVVITEAKNGDYDHMLATIKNHCTPKDDSHDH